MFDNIFKGRRFDVGAMISYGFSPCDKGYEITRDIIDGDFALTVSVSRDGAVATSLVECDTLDEYTLYKTDAEGAFVGRVREEIANFLEDVAKRCTVSSAFRARQTNRILRFVADKYGTEPEFLWDNSPDCAVLRRADTKKWYAIIMTIPKDRLGFESHEKIEVMNMRRRPDKMASLLEREGYYPGWHMNKKSWYTVILDSSLPDDEIERRLDESYGLAVK